MFIVTVAEKWAYSNFPLMICYEKFPGHPEILELPPITMETSGIILISTPQSPKFLWYRPQNTADTTIKWSIPQNPERW